jgi:hypothetical protein
MAKPNIEDTKGSDLSSASSVTFGDEDFYFITGTTTITSFTEKTAGVRRAVKFSGVLTLTHNATSLILPGEVNITTAANDRVEFISLGSGNWICSNYQRANGTALVASSGGGLTLISSQSASSSSTIDFTGLDSTYDVYMITGSNIIVSTNCTLGLQISTDGGSTWDTTSYYGGNIGADNLGTTRTNSYNNASSAYLTGALDRTNGGTSNGFGFQAYIYNLIDATVTYFNTQSALIDSTANTYIGFHGGGQLGTNTTAGDALRIIPTAGNITSGKFKIYGLQKS